MTQTYELGSWTFFPEAHELVCGEETVSLEHRAARALELLCQRRGQIVSQDDLTAHLWAGRQVSSNSVPVIIRDLRRALGDDARNPKYLQTIAKGGYRLIVADKAANPQPRPYSRAMFGLGAMALLLTVISAGAWFVVGSQAAPHPQTTLIVSDELPNATGNKAYDPLARASAELVVTTLSNSNRYQLIRSNSVRNSGLTAGGEGRVVRLTSKLVLWAGEPDIVFVATDNRTSAILWSGFAYGPEDTLPHKVENRLNEFLAVLNRNAPKSAT